MKRKIPLINDELYHVLNKSIAGFEIFKTPPDFTRMQQLFKYYQRESQMRFSDFMLLRGNNTGFDTFLNEFNNQEKVLVRIVAYCLMPTHFHLILKQLENDGISRFIGDVTNSYARYFNFKHKRKGPLWEGKFKNVIVEDDEQLLHLTRYIHINPSTAGLVEQPQKWPYSSYGEYLKPSTSFPISDYKDVLDIEPSSYRKFINERISFQRKLAKIKAQLLD